MRARLLGLLLTGVAAVLPACAQPRAQGEAGAPSQPASAVPLRAAQIIIKFRDSGIDLSRSSLLEEIGRDSSARLVYVRPMSGGAHVLRLENPVDGVELDRIIGRIATRQDVEYVEPDRPMQHMRERSQ